MQAIVFRRWEDGATDVWVSRQKYRDLEDAQEALNDRWNQVVGVIKTEPRTAGFLFSNRNTTGIELFIGDYDNFKEKKAAHA